MKKLAMLTVKGAIGLVPKAVRNKLKSNHKLTELYSRSLQRSGLFYGFPSEKKRMALYVGYLKRQNNELQSLRLNSNSETEITVIVIGQKNLTHTLQNLKQLGVSNSHTVIVTSNNLEHNLRSFFTIGDAIAELPTDRRVFFINSGDLITPEAFATFLQNEPFYNLAYCDTDRLDSKKRRVSPYFLPDWNPELQFSTGYVSTGVTCKADLIKKHSITSNSIAGMVTELWLKKPDVEIKHFPYTLIHRTADKSNSEYALADIRSQLKALTKAAPAYNKELAVNNVQWPLARQPLVTLIIPTKNAKELVKECIESILEKTDYQNYEILLIDNASDEKASIDYFKQINKHPKIRVLHYPGEFNYSAINNFGVQHACKESSVIGLINNDIEVISPNWLTVMVGHALRKDVGCVGAKLLYSDGRIQHAGVVMGYGGGAGHAHKYFPRFHPGYMKRLIATQNYSAVTAACLLVKKSLFLAVGGLNDEDLTVAFNDVDFCLRVKETGVRNVYCAEAELYHHESVSRGLDHSPEKAARFNRELKYLKAQWGRYITHDPAYSPNLTLRSENFSIKAKDEFSS